MTEIRMTVLIVDDDAVSRQLLREILKDRYNLSFATSGVEALKKVQNVKPDLILLDILMPEMDGYETCHKLKSDVGTSNIPVIFISSLSDSDVKFMAFKFGGVDYISKPFSGLEVIARVDSHIKLYNFQRFLEGRVEDEVERNRLKDHLINEQARHIAMGELLVNIAHHWRQPLNSIGVLVQDMQDAYLHKELDGNYFDKSILTIMTELIRLSNTINGFRNYYVAKQELKEFNLEDVVNSTIAIVEGYFKVKGFVINKEFENKLIISFYPNEFAQVLLNLLTNVQNVFEQRHITNGIVNIRAYRDTDTNKIVITITDNGGGVHEDNIHKIFDPYFTTKEKSQGTGLGLYIAKLIIERSMKGTLSVRNIDGWAEFRIEI
ncbi:hybrid sensor histidine kinase/response regulator [Candidatus Magnetomonas plexicatena]|uniref:hybrid sensor histidine kinase/response regulator n=1 Tax=Candidatus Magnetomonas plexicatena TaxID=2552947 RepID=UPI0011020F04|nr:hybrid sensor histidine kinase/response regulator [Nitrospirales bacterium LBB_01]